MTLTVSVSDLRGNISQYLERVMKGTRVLIRDEKRDVTIAQITPTATFDKEAFGKALKEARGIFTAGNHPEWKTKEDIIKWVEQERKAADRTF